jgi:hypothetical protein
VWCCIDCQAPPCCLPWWCFPPAAEHSILLHHTTAHPLTAPLPLQVEYEDLPAIISINQAVAAGSFLYTNEKGCGDVDMAFASGECEVGGRGGLQQSMWHVP